MLIAKIVSGGQTGVDRGALEAATELGFPYGGLIPKGRLAEDGIVPLKFDAMTEATRKDYLFRTEWNVAHSDCTLIISRYNLQPGAVQESLQGGTERTRQFCVVHEKPYLVIFKGSFNAVRDWLVGTAEQLGKRESGLVLNVAGPRESKNPGIQATTKEFVKGLILNLMAEQKALDNLEVAAKLPRRCERGLR